MPMLPPYQQPAGEHRKAEEAAMRRLADFQKKQVEAEERRRREERNRALAADARARASSSTQKK